jgi:hypothetical protein
MRSILTLLTLLLTLQLSAQNPTASKQKRIPIGKTGCTYINYCDTPFKVDHTTDSSRVYSTECTQADVTYGLICVQLKNPYAELTMAEDMMIAYVDFLKQNFTVTSATGYTKGYRLNDSDSTRGISDQWEDSEGDKWRIRAWTDGKFIGFMYTYSKKPIVEAKAEQYFEAFRFSAK